MHLRAWQEEAWKGLQTGGAFLLVHRRGGKSFYFSWLLLRHLVMPSEKPELAIVMTPQLQQCNDTVVRQVLDLADDFDFKVKHIRQQNLLLCEGCPNMVQLSGLTRGSSHIRGRRLAKVLIDESGEVVTTVQELWGALLPAMADRPLSTLLAAGTPPPKFSAFDQIKNFFQQAGFPVLKFDVERTGLLSEEQLRLSKLDQELFEREFMLRYSDSSLMSVFLGQGRLAELFGSQGDVTPQWERSPFDEVRGTIVAFDPALRHDNAVAAVRTGNAITHLGCMFTESERRSLSDEKLIRLCTQRLEALCISVHARRLTWDASGASGGLFAPYIQRICTRLNLEESNIRFGDPAIDRQKFKSRRAEIYWYLRFFLLSENCGFHLAGGNLDHADLERLKEELGAVEITSDQPWNITEKVRLSKRLGRSPDSMDVVALLCADVEIKAVDSGPSAMTAEQFVRSKMFVEGSLNPYREGPE